jgi:hypothetical protein
VFIRGSKHPAPNPPSHNKSLHQPLSLRTKKHRRVFPTDLEPKPDPPSFVPIRVHSWFKNTPHQILPRTPNHSTPRCLSVPKNTDAFSKQTRAKAELPSFASIRVHSWFKTPRTSSSLAQQITPPPSVSPRSKRPRRFPNRSRAKARTLPIREHSCPFVVQNTPPALVYRFPSVASQARPSATSRGRLHCCSHILWLRLWFCQKDRPSP